MLLILWERVSLSWLFLNLLYRPDWPQSGRFDCLCFQSAGTESMCHHCLSKISCLVSKIFLWLGPHVMKNVEILYLPFEVNSYIQTFILLDELCSLFFKTIMVFNAFLCKFNVLVNSLLEICDYLIWNLHWNYQFSSYPSCKHWIGAK